MLLQVVSWDMKAIMSGVKGHVNVDDSIVFVVMCRMSRMPSGWY
jgi:hypothetical protein